MLRLRSNAVAIVFMCAFLIGCALPRSPQEVSGKIAELQQTVTMLEATVADALSEREHLAAVLDLVPDGLEKERVLRAIAKADETVEAGRRHLGVAKTTMADLQHATAGAQNWGDVAAGVGGAVAPFLPPPYSLIVAAIASLIGLVLGKKRGDRNAIELARSIEAAKRDVPMLKSVMEAAAGSLRKYQSDAVHRLVDRAQGKV